MNEPGHGRTPERRAAAFRSRGARHWALALAWLLFAGIAAGCGSRPTTEQAAAARQQRSQKLIDAGNAAYQVGDYRLAARRYAAAAVEKNDDPAAYYGLGMALSKIGRDEEARTAYARARELTRQARGVDPARFPTNNAPVETIGVKHP